MDSSWQVAATRLKHLVSFLQRKWGHRVPRFGCAAIDFEAFFMLFPLSPPPDLVRFLCAVAPDESVDLGVIYLMTPFDLREYQTGATPVHDNTRFGRLALGSWTGEGDGDAWICNLHDGSIHALCLECGYEGSLEDTLKACYLHFDTLGQWVDYLIADAARREWLDVSDIPQVA